MKKLFLILALPLSMYGAGGGLTGPIISPSTSSSSNTGVTLSGANTYTGSNIFSGTNVFFTSASSDLSAYLLGIDSQNRVTTNINNIRTAGSVDSGVNVSAVGAIVAGTDLIASGHVNAFFPVDGVYWGEVSGNPLTPNVGFFVFNSNGDAGSSFNGSLLTGLTAANLTGTLPAIDGSALTNVIPRGTYSANTVNNSYALGQNVTNTGTTFQKFIIGVVGTGTSTTRAVECQVKQNGVTNIFRISTPTLLTGNATNYFYIEVSAGGWWSVTNASNVSALTYDRMTQ